MTALHVAGEALGVRALVLEALASGSQGVLRGWDAAVGAPVEAWDVVLRAERCAAPLAAALEVAGRLGALPDRTATLLQARRRLETLRAVRARSQLAEIGDAAAARGWKVVALKGAVALVRSPDLVLDLADLDLLVPEETVGNVTAWLDPTVTKIGRTTSPAHVAARYIPGGLPIEVHRAIASDGSLISDDVWRGTMRLRSGLLTLAPSEHLWHLLTHATVTHADRRGRIRDIVLIAETLRHTSGGDLDAVRSRARESPSVDAIMGQLEMAQAIAAGSATPDRFESLAFVRYALYRRTQGRWRRLPNAVRVLEWVYAWHIGPDARRQQWARISARSTGLSAHGVVAAVERLHPGLGFAWRRAVRTLFTAAAAASTWPVARWLSWRFRRLARR